MLQITPWERQALQLLADGATPTHVSIGLGLSAAETEALLARIFAAMSVATRADAVAAAQRRGLLRGNAPPVSALLGTPLAHGRHRVCKFRKTFAHLPC